MRRFLVSTLSVFAITGTTLHIALLGRIGSDESIEDLGTHPSFKVPFSTTDNPVNVSTAPVGRPHLKDHIQETPRPKEDSIVKPLNILIFYPDDWRHDSIGGVGPVVQTPFLNKLATEGMRFSHNCVTTSICWVSRASYFTGQYASRHKTLRLHKPKFYRNFKQASWPGLLRKAGFHVGHVGKWQFQNNNQFVENNFDYTDLYEGKHWFQIPGKEALVHASDHAMTSAIRFLRKRPKHKNFALTVAFYPPKAIGNSDVPGAQWSPKNESMRLYQNETIPEPEMNDSWKKLPYFFRDELPARSRWEERFNGTERYQASMKNYYRMITEVDSACETIFNVLSKQGILNETMVIFTADNGFFHGEHGLAGKWYPYQESIRVPLILWDPRMPTQHRNTVDSSFTLNIDLATTILAAAGLPPHPGMQGKDISRLYRPSEESSNWRDEFYYEYKLDNGMNMPMATALVRKDFKYIQWPQFAYEQLFDLHSDPFEQSDIANNTEYADILSEMRHHHKELEALAL